MFKKIPKNDKGGFFIQIIVILVLALAFSIFGFLFINKAVDKLNSIQLTTNIIIVITIIFIIIFREPVKAILMSLIGFIKR